MADSVYIGWLGPIKFVSSAGAISFGASIVPDADNTYDLGSASFRWRSAYLGTSALVSLSGIGTTPTVGIDLANDTAAAAGAQQMSGAIRLRARGWKTDATAASQTVDFLQDVLPVQGTSAPTGSWRLGYSINGGSRTNVLDISPTAVTSAVPVVFSGGSTLDGITTANQIHQRNGTTAQALYIYNTFTNASNYERIRLDFADPDTAIIGTQGSGTGAAPVVRLTVGGGYAEFTGGAILPDGPASRSIGSLSVPWGAGFFKNDTLGTNVLTLQTLATNDDPTENFQQGRVATTDATVTTLYTLTIPASTTYFVEARVNARRTGGAAGTAEDGAGYIRAATIKNAAGTATLIGAVATIATMEDQAGWDCTIDVTGATARVRVTGAVDNNVTWHATVRAYPVGS